MDFLTGVHTIISNMEGLPDDVWKKDFTMDRVSTMFDPCTDCMNTDLTEPECRRCHHKPNCKSHDEDDTCGCKVYTRPSLTRSKIGAVLHLQWTEPDGTIFIMDCDVNCPNLLSTTPYDGSTVCARNCLTEVQPIGWLDEIQKLEDMSSVAGDFHLKRTLRFKQINRKTVIAQQALLFLDKGTLQDSKLELYVLLKILKSCTDGKVTSFKCKYAVHMLMAEDPKRVGLGKCLKRIINYHTIKGKFDSVNCYLKAKKNITKIEVTDDGLLFLRNLAEPNVEQCQDEDEEEMLQKAIALSLEA